jgi:hypothetical protein
MFNLNNWSIAVFLSIQNLYDRKNVAGYQYNSNETKETVRILFYVEKQIASIRNESKDFV